MSVRPAATARTAVRLRVPTTLAAGVYALVVRATDPTGAVVDVLGPLLTVTAAVAG